MFSVLFRGHKNVEMFHKFTLLSPPEKTDRHHMDHKINLKVWYSIYPYKAKSSKCLPLNYLVQLFDVVKVQIDFFLPKKMGIDHHVCNKDEIKPTHTKTTYSCSLLNLEIC